MRIKRRKSVWGHAPTEKNEKMQFDLKCIIAKFE